MRKLLLTLAFIFLLATQGECAVKYAKNVTANWNVASSWSATASTGIDDDGVPDATSDCVFDANFTGSITLTASTTVNSVVGATGAAGTLTHNALVTLTIDGQDAGGDSLKFISTMTYTLGSTSNSNITFTGTGTSKITTSGKSIASMQFNNSGGTFQLQDDLVVVNGSGSSGGPCLYRQAGSFDPNGRTVSMNSVGSAFIRNTFTFYNFTRTGTGVKTDSLVFSDTLTVTNTLTLTGNSGINRLLVYSNTLGTARTITNTSVTETWSNVDFRDITMSEAVDASAITGGSGNCGGNTGITFTTADDWFWNGSGTRNFSDYTYWYTATNGGGSQMGSTLTPLPQDTCYIDGASIDGATTIDQDLPRIPGIDTTNASAFTFDMNNVAQTHYGSLNLSGVSTFNTNTNNVNVFEGRGSYTLTSNTKLFTGGLTLQAIGGTLQLLDNFDTGSGTGFRYLTISNGTFDANDNNVDCERFTSSNSNTRKIMMGSGTWTIDNTTDGWNLTTTTNLDTSTFSETSTITITNGTNAFPFGGGGLTYYNLNTGSGAANFTLTGSNTFNTFTINAPKTVKFTAGTTTTVNSLVATGTLANPIVITSATAATHTLTDTSGTNAVEYCTISYSIAGGGATWNAFTSVGNVDGGNNTGWVFTSGAVSQLIMVN